LLRLVDAVFEKDGKSIPYRKASLTPAGEAIDENTPLELVLKDAAQAAVRARKRKKGKAAAPAKRKRASKRDSSPEPQKPAVRAAKPVAAAPPAHLEDALRKWRLAEAKRRGVPAFRIFSDQALTAIAAKRPGSAAELLAIPGMGISNVEKYGAQLYRLLAETR
jgi:superfamily II DNA helicase RecQ